MAGRIRSIKPEILEDEKVAFLDHLAYRLFVGTWLVADDYGNLRADPGYLRGQIVWASRESREDVAKALDTLVEVSLLVRYSVRGQVYLHIKNWDRHQKVDKPGKPRMPGPADNDDSAIREDTNHSRGSREGLARARRNPETDLRPPTSDQDHDPERDQELPRREAAASPSPAFGDLVAKADAATGEVGEKRAEPVLAKRGAPKRALPGDWSPERSEANANAEAAARSRGVDLDLQLANLRDWAKSNNAKKADWDATWRNWTRNAKPSGPQRSGLTPLEQQLERVRMLEAEEANRDAG